MLQAVLDDPGLMIMATGALVGIAASLVGTFLVLRGSAMLSDAISHSIVFGIITVWLLTGQASGPVQLIGAALTGVLTVVLTEMLTSTRRVKSDAAIGLVFPALFSIGVLLINIFARDVHIDAHTVLLGEIGFVWLDTMMIGDYRVPQSLVWMGLMTALNLTFVTLFYKELKLATFDSALAKALGLAPGFVFYALLTLTSGTAVAAFDSVGVVLFVAFVVVPPAAAYLLTERLWAMLVIGCGIAALSSIAGYWLAVWLNVSIGGMMALFAGLCLALAWLFGQRHGLVAALARRRAQITNNAVRTLAVHLFNHEHGPRAGEENAASALGDHLHWSEKRAGAMLVKALDEGFVKRDGALLVLTEKGRASAREVLEPWAHRGVV